MMWLALLALPLSSELFEAHAEVSRGRELVGACVTEGDTPSYKLWYADGAVCVTRPWRVATWYVMEEACECTRELR